MNLFIQLIKDLCKWTCVCSGRREVVQLNYWRPNESWQVKQAIVTQQSGFFQGGAKHANLTTYGNPGLLFRMGLKCCRISLETYVSAVDPACKVRGFVHWNLTIQPGFCWLTLQQGISTKPYSHLGPGQIDLTSILTLYQWLLQAGSTVIHFITDPEQSKATAFDTAKKTV